MPKHPDLCPPNREIDLFPCCHFACCYCISHSRSTPHRCYSVPEALHCLAHDKQGDIPVYLSPWTEPLQRTAQGTLSSVPILEHLAATERPFFMITRSRDAYEVAPFFRGRSNSFLAISLNCLDDELVARLEPGAPGVRERQEMLEQLCAITDLRMVVKVDPVLPGLTDGRRLGRLLDWLSGLRPFTVTADTLRLTRGLLRAMEPFLGKPERDSLLAHYPPLNTEPQHPHAEYRQSLLQGIADQLSGASVRTAFCRVGLRQTINSNDCRGGF